MKKDSLIAALNKYYTDKHNGVEVGKIADIVTANGAKYEGGRYIVLDGEKTRLDTFCRANGVDTYNSYSKTADGEKTAQNKPRKTTARKGANAPKYPIFERLGLAAKYAAAPAVWLREDSECKTAETTAAAAFEYLCSLPTDNAAASYIATATNAAALDIDNAKHWRGVINRAADIAQRRADWLEYKTNAAKVATEYAAQRDLLAKLPAALRDEAIKAIEKNGGLLTTPAPFFGEVCKGLQIANGETNAANETETANAAAKVATAKRARKTA